MASNHHTGAIRKQNVMRKSVRIPREHSPTGGIAIPSHIESMEKDCQKRNNSTSGLNSVLKMRQEIENIGYQTGAIRKQNIRKSEWMQKEYPPTGGIALPSDIESVEKDCQKRSYSTPQLNSVLKIKQEIENIEALKGPALKDIVDLTPRSKSAIMPKINQKLNFDANRPVFKDLPSLNVNDSLLLPKEKPSIRKKYVVTSKKIPAPELCDFLDPLPPLTHVVPLPEIIFEFPEYQYDVLGAYKDFIGSK